MINSSSLNVSKVRSAIPCEPYTRGFLVQSSDSFYLHRIPADRSKHIHKPNSAEYTIHKISSHNRMWHYFSPFFVTALSTFLVYRLNELQILEYHIRHSISSRFYKITVESNIVICNLIQMWTWFTRTYVKT